MRPNKKNNKHKHNKYELTFHKGHKIKVPNHPTDFYSKPWFPLTLRVQNPTGFVGKDQLYNSIASQLKGVSFVGSVLNIRVMSVRVWGPIPTTNTPLVLRVFDVFDEVLVTGASDQMILEEITDYADQVNRARVGYVFSSAQQQKSLIIGAGNDDKFIALGGAGANSIMYVSLLWRPYNVDVPALSRLLSVGSDSSMEVVSRSRRSRGNTEQLVSYIPTPSRIK